jgi:hypothetical protein
MDWKNVASKITSVAPMLGSLLGPGGTLAGTAIKMIGSALGTESTEDAITTALQADPEAMLKLKQFELDNKVELRKIVLEQERVRLADVADARSRQIEHEKTTGKSDTNLYVLAWTVVSGFFGLMGLLCFKTLPGDSSGVVFMLFGALATGFGQVLGYFFGSSKSSADKTKLLKPL